MKTILIQYWYIWLPVFVVLNLISFVMFGRDKKKAEQHAYRTTEAALIRQSFFGPLGGLAGMYLFHHKTRKLKFQLTVPLFLLLHIAAAILILLFA